MDSPFPSFRLIEKQRCGGAEKNRFLGAGIRRRERKRGQAFVGDVSGRGNVPLALFLHLAYNFIVHK